MTRKVRRTRKDGRAYLDIELADRSGRVRARVWEAVELLDGRFDTGDTVRVLGRVGSYEGRVELELRDVERLPDGDPLELVPGARRDVDDLDGYLDFLVAEIHDDALRAVVERILDRRGLPRALPRRRGDRVRPPRLRGRADRAHRRGHGAVPRDGAVAARLDIDVLTAAALLHDCGTPDALADGPVIRPSPEGLALGTRPHGTPPHRERRDARRGCRASGCSRCSRASPPTTGRPRAAASRAPRPSRCTPPTRSTRGSPRRAARSASSRRASVGGYADARSGRRRRCRRGRSTRRVLLRGTAGGTPRPGRTGRPRRSRS